MLQSIFHDSKLSFNKLLLFIVEDNSFGANIKSILATEPKTADSSLPQFTSRVSSSSPLLRMSAAQQQNELRIFKFYPCFVH